MQLGCTDDITYAPIELKYYHEQLSRLQEQKKSSLVILSKMLGRFRNIKCAFQNRCDMKKSLEFTFHRNMATSALCDLLKNFKQSSIIRGPLSSLRSKSNTVSQVPH